MFPLDPASGPGERPRERAMTHGGTFVRPGAIAWGQAPCAPGRGPCDADAACDEVEKALTAMARGDGQPNDLLDELARARIRVPLPAGPRLVTDGSAVALPVVTYLGAEFVPCFTSARRLARYAGKRLQRSADARRIPHIVVPAAALARQLPPGLGMALNPGAEASFPIYPEGVAYLAGEEVRVGPPPAEPDTLLREVGRHLRQLPAVVAASRAWLSVPGAGEGLVFSVTLEDPASPTAHAAVVGAIEQAVASLPRQPGYPIDVTFPGESAPDVVDDWIAAHPCPFYIRDDR
jgi:type III secretion system (T3SS) SseB-like protein